MTLCGYDTVVSEITLNTS